MQVRLLSTLVCLAITCCAAPCALAGSAAAAELPDGRIYEQVTPEEKLGSEAYQPENFGGNGQYQKTHTYSVDTNTQYTFQAAANGSGIAYVAAPTVGGSENEGDYGGNEYLATQLPGGGWSNKVLSPEGAPSVIFQAFTPDLSTAFVNSIEPLSSLAPGFGEAEEHAGEGYYDTLYSMDTAGSEYVPFFSVKPPYRTMDAFGTVYGTSERPLTEANSHRVGHEFLSLEGASADYTHLLFAANDALTGAAEGRPAAEGGAGAEFAKENNLYESVNGQLRLVNVLPNGTTQANAAFGGVEGYGGLGQPRPIFSRAISADGSRVFWTDLDTGHIYVREDGARTVEISPAGTYQTATVDGSTVFYTNGDLYAYEVASGDTTDLTPGVTVERVLGASEDGAYIYYVTTGSEVMLWHAGVSTPITTVLFPAQMSSEVTPDGHSIVFTVREAETSFYEFQAQVEVYNAVSGTLNCISCTSDETIALNGFGSTLPKTNYENVYQPRWITPDGSRVFFLSTNGLVPQDTNELDDVYEWVRSGTGGCTESAGCVYLLSGGTSTDNSYFLDASENGEDVFIVTRANLVGSDEDGLYDVYDVRTGKRAPAPPACTGAGCQGVPPAPPTFATPSTLTFSGLGNLTPKSAKTHNGKQAKNAAEGTRKARLRRALKRCRLQHRRSARKRRACTRSAKSARLPEQRAARDRHHNGRGK
ncbi:MAG TPA: hypothetical protein VGF95_00420 [Solirubrobacteraceae bacterium]|jgi:hypothetical protein